VRCGEMQSRGYVCAERSGVMFRVTGVMNAHRAVDIFPRAIETDNRRSIRLGSLQDEQFNDRDRCIDPWLVTLSRWQSSEDKAGSSMSKQASTRRHRDTRTEHTPPIAFSRSLYGILDGCRAAFFKSLANTIRRHGIVYLLKMSRGWSYGREKDVCGTL